MNMVTSTSSNYKITSGTTGIVLAFNGSYVVIYPGCSMAGDFKRFGYWNFNKAKCLHLGLFGVQWGSHK